MKQTSLFSNYFKEFEVENPKISWEERSDLEDAYDFYYDDRFIGTVYELEKTIANDATLYRYSWASGKIRHAGVYNAKALQARFHVDLTNATHSFV